MLETYSASLEPVPWKILVELQNKKWTYTIDEKQIFFNQQLLSKGKCEEKYKEITSTVPTSFNSYIKCLGIPGIIHDRTPDHHQCMTSQLNVALLHKLRGSLMFVAHYFDILSMGVCITRRW